MYSEYYLTGATGFLGSHVLDKLLKSGAKVNALVLPNDKNPFAASKGSNHHLRRCDKLKIT